MTNASLVVVGTGIKFMSHLTIEARANIEQADIVLYLVNEPMMKEWIQKANVCTESLENLYYKHESRVANYHAITEYILEVLRKQKHVCVVMYGHPAVFATPALDAAIKARAEGYDARVLPAISAEDCLFADLLIDPGSVGCVSFEATDLLVYQREFDVNCHLILWQVDVIGGLGHQELHDNEVGINLLHQFLLKKYPADHPVIIYIASQYPGMSAEISEIKLSELVTIDIPSIATLYLPPANRASANQSIINQLNISIS